MKLLRQIRDGTSTTVFAVYDDDNDNNNSSAFGTSHPAGQTCFLGMLAKTWTCRPEEHFDYEGAFDGLENLILMHLYPITSRKLNSCHDVFSLSKRILEQVEIVADRLRVQQKLEDGPLSHRDRDPARRERRNQGSPLRYHIDELGRLWMKMRDLGTGRDHYGSDPKSSWGRMEDRIRVMHRW